MVNQSENRPRWRLQPPTKGVQMDTVCMCILLLRPFSPQSLVPDPTVFSTVGALQTKALLHRVDMLKGNPTNELQVRIFHHAREINLLLFGDWLPCLYMYMGIRTTRFQKMLLHILFHRFNLFCCCFFDWETIFLKVSIKLIDVCGHRTCTNVLVMSF